MSKVKVTHVGSEGYKNLMFASSCPPVRGSRQVAAAEHISKLSLPGNRVGLKYNWPSEHIDRGCNVSYCGIT